MPEHATVPRPAPHRVAPAPGLRPVAPAGRPPARAAARPHGAVRAPRADPGPPRRRPPAAQPRVHLGDRDHARRDRRHAGLAAAPEHRHLPRGADADDARAPERDAAGADRRAARSGERIRDAAARASMIDPPAGDTRFLTARGRDRRRARGAAHASRRASARSRSWPTAACVPGALAAAGTPAAALAAQLNGQPRPDAGAGTPPPATPHRPRPDGDRRARRPDAPRRTAGDDRRPVTPAGAAAPAGVGACSSIERRIGLLFAVFLARARDRRDQGRLARRRQGRRRSSGPPSTQQEADIDDPGPPRLDHRRQRHRPRGLRARDGHRRHDRT